MQKTIIGCWFPLKKQLSFIFLTTFLLLLNGCFQEKNEVPTTEKGKVVLKKVGYSQLSGWKNDDFAEIIPVFAKNCQAVLKNKNTHIYNSAIKVKTADYQRVCKKFNASAIKNGSQMKKFIENEFVPYSVSNNGVENGKFTSYYEAVIYASWEKTAKYKFPIYGRPQDLIEINLKDFDSSLPNTRLVGRVDGKKFVPYYNRREIEQNGVEAPVLMWGDDLVDIHFMQIQGSAIAIMNDGTEQRIGFADSNGRKFKGIGSILLQKGLIKQGEASMTKIREWLRKNPQKAAEIMAENERFIFQRAVDADGPIGAMGLSLTAGRSMAVDNQFIPLGAMLWLDTVNPDNDRIEKVVFAQDIGSAIKGVVRGDYFWGHGEEALAEAGRMNSVGKYYLLAPKYSTPKVN